MSLRLTSLQAIYWSHMAPSTIPLTGSVTVMCGANGSGKSSAMDAIKAVLGARRFGQGRTPAHYIHRGPDGQADYALVLLGVSGLTRLRSDGSDTGTLCLSVTRRSRRFLLTDEPVTLAEPLTESAAAFIESMPRERWLAPERWAREVMEPLGVGAVMLRLLELPQGEAHRVIQSRQAELVPQLLGMLGYQDRLEELASQRARLGEAQGERDAARKATLSERRRVSSLEEGFRLAEELSARREETSTAGQILGAALTRRIGTQVQLLAGAAEAESEATQHASAADEAAAGASARLRERASRLGLSTRQREELSWAGVEHSLTLVDEHLNVDAGVRDLIHELLGRRRFTLVGQDDEALRAAFKVARRCGTLVARAPQAPTAPAPSGSARALAGATHPAVDAYLERIGFNTELTHDGDGAWFGSEWHSDPGGPGEDALEAVGRAEQARADARHARDRARTERLRIAADLNQLRSELAGLGDLPESDGGDVDVDLDELRAERRAREHSLGHLAARVRDLVGDEGALTKVAERYEAAKVRLDEAERVLGDHDETLERLMGALTSAQEIWRDELGAILGELRERFGTLAEAAGMEGELVVEPDPVSGARIDLLVREHPGRPLKGFFRDGDLSGGWRVKIGMVLLLAALTGEHSDCPLVMIDEHAASLDEERSQELGDVFRRLAEQEGLQFVLCAPTKRVNEGMDWCDAQIGFLAPEGDAEWAPAPLVLQASRAAASTPGSVRDQEMITA